MTMEDFAEIIKLSKLVGKDKRKIIRRLLKAAGAEKVDLDESIPSDTTIYNWLKNKGNGPNVERLFPNLKLENEEVIHKNMIGYYPENKWKKLRDLFERWHSKNITDEEFYINTKTEDFITFDTSFWRQFVSFFIALRMWDGAEEQDSEMEGERKNLSGNYMNEMMKVFKETFVRYKVYEFIPKSIEEIMNSLFIFHGVLDEGIELTVKDGDLLSFETGLKFIKMYCKWYPDCACFTLHAANVHKNFWELKIQEEQMIFKSEKDIDYDTMPTNIWMPGSFKYAIVSPGIIEEQYEDEALIWKECQGEIILVGIDMPSEENPVIEDCHLFIDRMLELDSMINEFTEVIDEKIIKKYENISFDNDSKLIYNNIQLYKKALKNFKKSLIQYRNLRKEKDAYLEDQAFTKSFDMYAAFGRHDELPKPQYPFSECYLKPEEARKVEAKLCRYHKDLMELYTEILN